MRGRRPPREFQSGEGDREMFQLFTNWLRCHVRGVVIAAAIGAIVALQSTLAWGQNTPRLKIKLHQFKCVEETNDGPGDDEIYVVVFVADMRGVSLPLNPPETMTFNTRVFEDVDNGSFRHPQKQVWALNGTSAARINDPDDVLILAGVMENDSARPSAVNTAVQAIASVTLMTYLNDHFDRDTIVRNLRRDMNNALDGGGGLGAVRQIPFSNGDERIGGTQELRLTAADLEAAHNGTTVTKTLEYRGDGGHYRLYFDISSN